MSRILGLDHGSRRIGLAIGDTETGMAFARPALRRRGDEADLRTIADLAHDEGVERVVIGLPANMDGSEGPQAGLARRFGERLGEIGLAVGYQDERLTSWQAREVLQEAGRHPRRGTGEVDSTAARILLQEYLDTTKESR